MLLTINYIIVFIQNIFALIFLQLQIPFCKALLLFISLRRALTVLYKLDSTAERATSAKNEDHTCNCCDNLSQVCILPLQALTSKTSLCITEISNSLRGNENTYLQDHTLFLLFTIKQMRHNLSVNKTKLDCLH